MNTNFSRLLPGLAIASLVVAAAWMVNAPANFQLPIGRLSGSLLLGLLLGNLLPNLAKHCVDGTAFARRHVLRVAVVLYGFRLTFGDFERGGVSVLVTDIAMLATTFAIAMFVGVKLLKMSPLLSSLIGAGASVCGASAVLATAPVVRANAEQSSIAVATVVAYGVLGFIVYPALYHFDVIAALLPPGVNSWGLYIGSTVHEVGQVVAISNAVGGGITDQAVIAKMGRVALLAPFLIALALFHPSARETVEEDASVRSWREFIPWLPLAFLAVVAVNSFVPLAGMNASISRLDEFLLAVAMASLGISTRITSLLSAGAKPMLLAGILFLWLVIGGALINGVVTSLFQ